MHELDGFLHIFEYHETRGRDMMLAHELLGVGFGIFDFSGCLGGAKNTHLFCLETIDDTKGEGKLRSNDG